MAASTLKDFLIGIGFDVDEAGSARAESVMDNIHAVVDKLGHGLKNAGKGVKEFIDGAKDAVEPSKMKGAKEGATNVHNLDNQLKKASGTIKKFAAAAVTMLIGSGIKSAIADTIKFSEGLVKSAKELKRTVEEARAYNTALKVMGKTAEEIEGDEHLKSLFEDLKGIGHELALPEAAHGVTTIRNLMDAFTQLRFVANYALQWIMYKVQTVAEGPLSEVRDLLIGIRDWFSNNIQRIAGTIANVFGKVVQVLTSIVKFIGLILQGIDKLPASVKIAGAVILAVIAAIKSKLFLISFIISAVGLLIDDFMTYLEGGDALFSDFWGWAVNALGKVKSAIEEAKTAISGFWEDAKGEDGKEDFVRFGMSVGTYLINGFLHKLGNFADLIKKWITGDENASWEDAGNSLVTKLANAVKQALQGANDIVDGIVASINESMLAEGITNGLSNANSFLGGIIDAIIAQFPSIGEKVTGFASSIIGLISSALETVTSTDFLNAGVGVVSKILVAIVSAITQAGATAADIITLMVTSLGGVIGNALATLTSDEFRASADAAAQMIINSIVNGIGSVGTGAANIASALRAVISNALSHENISGLFGENGTVKNLASRLITGLATAIGSLTNKVSEIASEIAGLITDIDWAGVSETLSSAALGLINQMFNDLSTVDWPGIAGNIGKVLGSALAGLGNAVIGIGTALIKWFVNPDTYAALWNVATSIISAFVEFIASALQSFWDNSIFGQKLRELGGYVNDWINKSFGESGATIDATFGITFGGIDFSGYGTDTMGGAQIKQNLNMLLGQIQKDIERAIEGELDREQIELNIADFLSLDSSLDTAYGAELKDAVDKTLNYVFSGESFEPEIEVEPQPEFDFDEMAKEAQKGASKAIEDGVAASGAEAQAAPIPIVVDTSNIQLAQTDVETTFSSMQAVAEASTLTVNADAQPAVEEINKASDRIKTVIKQIRQEFGKIPSAARNAFEAAARNMKSSFTGIADWFSREIGKIRSAINSIPRNISFSTSGLPGHSEGGVITRETISRLGEGGKKEYVIPVTKPARAFPLLKQAAADLGINMQSLANANKMLGGSATRNVTPSYAVAGGGTTSVINNYHNNNVNAPANINVSGTNDRSIADMVSRDHEKIVLRNIKSVLA